MFIRFRGLLWLTFAQVVMCANVAGAHDLSDANAAANCSGYNLLVDATSLSPGTNYTIDYRYKVITGSTSRFEGTINFTATFAADTEFASQFWNLTAPSASVSGSARLTSSGSSVPIIINGSSMVDGSAVLNCGPGQVPWRQGPELVGTGVAGFTFRGAAVALSADGNTALIGDSLDNNSVGAAWVFTRSGAVWAQQGPKLVGTGAVNAADQGTSVALSADGNTALVGGIGDNDGAGAVWVFTRSGGVWAQQGSKLVGTGASAFANQGWSVALSADGNTALMSGPNDSDEAGAVWVFTRSGGVWTQQGSKLVGTGASAFAFQGFSVALSADGNTALVGGPSDDKLGATWVFTRSGGVWTQQGSKLVGTGASAFADQGEAVALSADGNTAVVGGPFDDEGLGATWVFTRSGGVWTQQGSKLVGTGAINSAPNGVRQGSSVTLSTDGNIALIGGPNDNTREASPANLRPGDGAIWAFTRSGGVWTQQGAKLIVIGAVEAELGSSVALSADGSTALAGGAFAEAAWVFINRGRKEFAGTPGTASCYQRSVRVQARNSDGLSAAAKALGYRSIAALERSIVRFCGD